MTIIDLACKGIFILTAVTASRLKQGKGTKLKFPYLTKHYATKTHLLLI